MNTFQKITVCILMLLVTLAALYIGQTRNQNNCLYFYHTGAREQIEFMQWALGQPDFTNRELVAINEYKTEACLYQY